MNQSKYYLYQEIEDKCEDLQQGDILEPTEDIRNILFKSYPSLREKKIVALIVITQSCDLARREEHENRCKAEYINLAIVQRIEHVFLSLVDKLCHKHRLRHGYYSATGKNSAIELIGRICNQNEWSIGLFYLHPDASAGVAYRSVALLQAIYPVFADHYNMLVDVRGGRLAAPFQNRLGWLVGNLYSRVATVDFPENEQNNLRESLMNEDNKGVNLPCWLNKKQISKMKADGNGITKEQLDSLLDQYDPSKENMHSSIKYMLEFIKSKIGLSDEQKKAIQETLYGDSKFKQFFD